MFVTFFSRWQGHITEDDFTHWVRKMPDETLSAILDFNIVPPPLNDEAQKIFSQRHQGPDDDPFVGSFSLMSCFKIESVNESFMQINMIWFIN